MDCNVTIQPLSPFNYHDWNMKVILVLKNKSLFRVTMETEKEANVAKDKEKLF